jgi:hypothetical protein
MPKNITIENQLVSEYHEVRYSQYWKNHLKIKQRVNGRNKAMHFLNLSDFT